MNADTYNPAESLFKERTILMVRIRIFYFFPAFIVLAVLLSCLFLPSVSYCTESEIKIGVLAYRGREVATGMWSQTASYLTQSISQHVFTIVPLDFDEIGPAVEKGNVDFVIANSEYTLIWKQNMA